MSETKMTEIKMRTCKTCNIEKKLNTDNFYKNGMTKKNEMKFKGKCKRCFINKRYKPAIEKTESERKAWTEKVKAEFKKNKEKRLLLSKGYCKKYNERKKQERLLNAQN